MKSYLVQAVSPGIVAEVADGPTVAIGVPDSPPGVVPMKTLYPVTGVPPVDAGAVQERATERYPVSADTEVGALGTVDGVRAADATDAAPVPPMLVAVTRNV